MLSLSHLTNYLTLGGLGIRYTHGGLSIISEHAPITIFYTPAGDLAGVGVRVFGDGPSGASALAVTHKYLLPAPGGGRDISVSFRSVEAVCSTEKSSEAIGDRLVINQQEGGIAKEIPLTSAEAKASHFQAGLPSKAFLTHNQLVWLWCEQPQQP